MPLSCIIYDLDGTLVDSAPDIAIAINRIRSHFSLEEISQDTVRGFIGNGADRLVERAIFGLVDSDAAPIDFKTVPVSAAEIHQVVTDFQDVYTDDAVIETKVFPGAEKILAHWQSQGVAQVCLTNKPHDIAVQILGKLGLLPFFDLVVGDGARDDDNKILPRKPDTAVLDFILEQAGSDLNETVLIGDGIPDFDLAEAGGLRCVGLTSGYTPADLVMTKLKDPSLAAQSFDEVGEILERLNQSI